MKKQNFQNFFRSKITIIVLIALIILIIFLFKFFEKPVLSPEEIESITANKTLEIILFIQGLAPIEKVELYEDYPVYYAVFTDYNITSYDLSVLPYETNLNVLELRQQVIDLKAEIIYKDGSKSEFYLSPSFIILSEPPTETDTATETIEIPFSREIKELKVYYNDIEKLSINVKELLCNYNLACNDYENYYSCPEDCKNNEADGICVGYSGDGFCDLDCYEDEDCGMFNFLGIQKEAETYPTETEEELLILPPKEPPIGLPEPLFSPPKVSLFSRIKNFFKKLFSK